MDKIKYSTRSGVVDIKEVCKKWEEELFSLLLADKDMYLPSDPLQFEREVSEDLRYINAKVSALQDVGVIDLAEYTILTDKFYEITDSYMKSKVKEEC